MDGKILIVPLISPVVSKRDSRLLFEEEIKKAPESGYIDSAFFNKVFDYVLKNVGTKSGNKKDCDNCYFLIGSSAGEGENLNFELWQQLLHQSIAILKSAKIRFSERMLVGMINSTQKDFVSSCLAYLDFIRPDHKTFNLYFNFSQSDDILEDRIKVLKKDKLNFLLGINEHEADNKIVIEKVQLLREKGYVVSMICDARNFYSHGDGGSFSYDTSAIIELKQELPDTKILDCWPDRYFETVSYVDGGNFPLTLIEPELLYDLTCRHSSFDLFRFHTITSLVNKFSSKTQWRYGLKDYFQKRPFSFRFDLVDFQKAWNLFFENYSAEPVDNIHVLRFDSSNPVLSILKTFFTDLLSFQTAYFKFRHQSKELLFYPHWAKVEIYEKEQLNEVQRWKLQQNVNFAERFVAYCTNNYDIENNVLRYNRLFGDQGLFKLVDELPEDTAITEFKERRLGNFTEHTFDYRFVSDNGGDDIQIKMKYFVNLKYCSYIPDFIFRNIFQIAVFTKRSKIASEQLEKQAIQAAISQVMARNMSHNIGSHVMNKMLKESDIQSSIDVKRRYYRPDDLTEIDFNDQILKFNKYLKARMDYLADVTFGTPVMQTNKNLYGEIFKGLDENRLLLNNISALGENFKYKIIFKFNGEVLSAENDVKIALPNDLLGSQAFYNILENIIRNTAKHSKNKPNLVLFSVNISDCKETPSLYKVEIFDNVVHFEHISKEEKALRLHEYNLYQDNATKATELSTADWIVFKQNQTINESILDSKTNRLRTNALGIIEIETSASYLRKLDITDIESDQYALEHNEKLFNKYKKLNVLKAFNQDGSLGYRFFVLKPAELLLVGDFPQKVFDKKNDSLKQGIWIWTVEQFTTSPDVFNHQFLLYEGEVIEQYLELRKTLLPTRCIKMDAKLKDKIISTLLNQEDILTELESVIWEEWNDLLFATKGIKKVNLQSTYEQNESGPGVLNVVLLNHAKEWAKNADSFKPYGDAFASKTGTKNTNYLECLSSASQQKLPGFKDSINSYLDELADQDLQNRINTFKLNESFLSRILVIDERIQDTAVNHFYPYEGLEIPYGTLYLYSDIILPIQINSTNKTKIDKQIDLSARDFNDKIINSIKLYISAYIKDCDFVLIHYSILERMFAVDKLLINQYLKELAAKTRVVITSGRGKPSNMPDYVSFINLTPILDAFVENRSKYSINYLLNSSRV